MNEDEIKFKMWVPSPVDVVNVLTVSCATLAAQMWTSSTVSERAMPS